MTPIDAFFLPLQLGDLIPTGTRVAVFEIIFRWFLILGTLVGIVVISYMLWNAYKFRATGDEDKYADERPEMGEIPTGGGKGRKLFLSFSMSAIIVISLIVWTYGAVLYVEQSPQQIAQEQGKEPIDVTVTGHQFGWKFTYDNYDYTSNGKLVIPKGHPIALTVTSSDVFHNFGIPAFRIKADAIPGQMNDVWFIADKTSTEQDPFLAKCYELCGAGHSTMRADVVVLNEQDWQQWKAQNLESSGNESASANGSVTADAGSSAPAPSVTSPARTTAGGVGSFAIAPARAGGN